MITCASKPKPDSTNRDSAEDEVKIQQESTTNNTRFFVTMASYLSGYIKQVYRSTLRQNKFRNVAPAPIAPNVSDMNHRKQALERFTFPNPTLTIKLVCENSPTKRSEVIKEQSRPFFGECSAGVRIIAHRTKILNVIAVVDVTAFAVMRRIAISRLYQETSASRSRNVQCYTRSAV